MDVLARSAVEEGAGAGGPARAIPVLTFHAIEDSRDVIDFPPGLFRAGLKGLAARSLRAEPLESVAACIRRGAGFAARTMALTFDDGYRTVYTDAFPVLASLGMSATVFLCTGRDAGSSSASGLPSLGGRPMLSWGQIREMHRAGISFGAHTLTHPDLTRLAPREIEVEIRESQARIEDAIGARVRTFAYPFGRFNRASREIAAQYFDAACSDRLGLVRTSSDILALPRVDAYYLRSERTFAGVPSRFFGPYVAARALPRAVRRLMVSRAGG